VVAPGDIAARRVAANFSELVARSFGVRLPVRTEQARNAIRFVRTRGGPNEAYRIEVRPTGITVSASADAGLAHGATTLWQMVARSGRALSVPAASIEDEPRIGWRGVALDSELRSHAPAYVRRLIDWMWLRKLNVLHWRLAGPSAFRLEIRARSRPPRPSVWYSQDTVRALVAYAYERGIVVVPRFDAPGSSVTDEALREVLALFPSRHIDFPEARSRLEAEGRRIPEPAVLFVAEARADPLALYMQDYPSVPNLMGIEAQLGEGAAAPRGRLDFPHADVVAELAWSPPAPRSWSEFSRRAALLSSR
jgi:N-acetyl-beta-hexosaminidase